MLLFIHSKYQDRIKIEIAGTAKILDLKKMISGQINMITAPDQILKFRSKTLTDSDTIQSSGIQPNSVVELSLANCYKIFIRTENNDIHELQMHYLHTIMNVKNMLYDLLKNTADEQRLLFNGKELANDDMLTEKMIKPGSTLELKVIIINLQLNIVRQSGQVARIGIRRNSTVQQLKQMLSTKHNIPPGYQVLTYNGLVLEKNENTLADYNIKNLSEIHFRSNDIQVHIRFETIGRDPITLRALPVDTIGQLKDKIEVETKLCKSAQQILWRGRALEDDAILSCELIHDRSTLNLVMSVQNLKLNIQIGPGDKITIDAQSTETVAQLKTKLYNTTKIPINQQTLFVDNTKLEDSKMLIDYGLNNTSDIALERKDTFEIIIQTLSAGQNISIHVHKDDGVIHIKEQINRRLGIQVEHQRLLYFGKELSDETLDDYRIENGSVIHLVIRLPGGIE